jgi:hypothetical protein
MTSEVQYVIDGQPCTLDVAGSPAFAHGKPEQLSRPDTDITSGQAWYDRGYGIFRFLDDTGFASLREGIARSIRGIVASLGVDTAGFELETYHRYVRDDALHRKVVGITRDLFPDDFNFPILDTLARLERLLGFGLTDVDPDTGEKLHIIVRINRPDSHDFNPPHKDIYEAWDADATLPRFANFWIPICGVTPQSSLPLVPGSHRLPEDRIVRTFAGGVAGGNEYRVRTVLRWDGSNELQRPAVGYGEVLIFSSHLVHGCAINRQDDATRVALEFRLYRKD